MSKINILAADVGFRNFGMAKFTLDIETLELEFIKIRLVETHNETKVGGRKVVRQNSDDLRSSKHTWGKFQEEFSDCALVFAEVPSGAQTARAALGFGMQIGLLAACPKPLIEVMPLETKEAAIGRTKGVEKAHMIAWATALYPQAGWKLVGRDTQRQKKGDYHDDNEHCADACGIAHAGILTDEFRRLRAAWLSNPLLRAA